MVPICGEIDQVTAVFAVPVTVAANCCGADGPNAIARSKTGTAHACTAVTVPDRMPAGRRCSTLFPCTTLFRSIGRAFGGDDDGLLRRDQSRGGVATGERNGANLRGDRPGDGGVRRARDRRGELLRRRRAQRNRSQQDRNSTRLHCRHSAGSYAGGPPVLYTLSLHDALPIYRPRFWR